MPTRASSWQLAVGQRETKKNLTMKSPHLQLQTLFSQRNLSGTRYQATVPLTTLSDSRKKSPTPVSIGRDESNGGEGVRLIGEKHGCIVNMEYLEQVNTL